MRNIERGVVVASILLLLAACATTPPRPVAPPAPRGTTLDERMMATQRVNEIWATDNTATRASLSVRTVKASPSQVSRAARAAMEQLGLDVDAKGLKGRTLTATKVFKNGGWSWSPAVRQAEEPRLKQALHEVLGTRGDELLLGTLGDEVLTGTATVATGGKGVVKITVDFSSKVPGADCTRTACIDEMPPAALRAAYYEFWTAFDQALANIRRTDAEAHKKRSQAPTKQKAKPPSDWVLPPSGWKPPPK
jgi:hypothetical protein